MKRKNPDPETMVFLFNNIIEAFNKGDRGEKLRIAYEDFYDILPIIGNEDPEYLWGAYEMAAFQYRSCVLIARKAVGHNDLLEAVLSGACVQFMKVISIIISRFYPEYEEKLNRYENHQP